MSSVTKEVTSFGAPLRRVLAICVAILALAASGAAYAQSAPPPPVRSARDSNGVDLMTLAIHVAQPSLTIGQPGQGGLTFGRAYDSATEEWRDNLTGTINSDGATYTVTLFGESTTFTLSAGVYTATQGDGATLTFNAGANTYTFTSARGVVALYSKALAGTQPTQANEGRVVTVTYPNGEALTFTYTTLSANAQRLQAVTNTLGYQIHLQYQNNDLATGGLTLVNAVGLNMAIDYCNPAADVCTGLTQTWPNLAFATNGATQTVTDALNRTTTYTFADEYLVGIRRPSASANSVTISYDASGRVASVYDGAGTWAYAFSDAAGVRTTTVTDPLNHQRVVTGDIAANTILTDRDALNRTTSFSYDASNRLTRVTRPEGNYTDLAYDGRGNVTQVTEVPKAGSGLANIVAAATYPAACANPVTCNLPTRTTDARGNATDFTYDSTHGGVLTVTAPDPDGAGPAVRPQTRFTYTSLSAWYKNASGAVVQAPSPVVRLAQVSVCRTTASCANGADETRATFSYGAPGGANNLLVMATTAGSGDGALAATTGFSYDAIGNLLTLDGPLAGSADTTRTRYDAARQVIGVIGPDPDGAGALKHRAARLTYNLDGQPTAIEQGAVNSQSDADWAAFAALQQSTFLYDAPGRRVRESFIAGGATQAVTQFSYDAASRPDCTALRMNPAVFASLPASACTLSTQGANGADRISRVTYNAADQATQVTNAYGTALAQASATTTYTANGLPATLADARGNLTTFEYDGFDRLSRIRFPLASNGSQSSTTDYEQYSYDAGSNVTQTRRRDGQVIAYVYDALARLTQIDAPGAANDVTTAYDAVGRLISAALPGQSLTFAYDALGRQTSAGAPLGTVASQYDLAGRRTRLTWPDGFYVTSDWSLANEMTALRENGAASGPGVLATFAYDDLGRRTGLARGNGAGTTYAYDAASRLTSLLHDLAGTSQDQTTTFTYNGAFQALTRTGANAAYDWAPLANGTTASPANGLNQYSSVGGAALAYDGRGNLASDSSRAFAYDVYNRLTSVSGAASLTLAYDPAGRLTQTIAGAATTRFLYDPGSGSGAGGLSIIGEYDGSGTLLRRYVHGPAVDEPLVTYDGAGTSNRAWLIADALGSVIASTNASAAATTINTYDEFGRPGAGNTGLFGFTGQMNLAAAGLQHYRARAYDPALGRFLQADPILFGGGMNLYAYVANDPVNLTDPSGLQAQDNPPSGDDEITVTGIRICPRGSRCITDSHRIRQVLADLTEYIARTLGDQVARRLVRAFIEAAQEAQCASADAGFAIPGLPEGLFSSLPGNATFTSIGAQVGGPFLGAFGVSATRYSDRTTGQRTYSYSLYGFAGSTVSRGQPLPQGVADSAGGRRLGVAGGLIWGTAQNTGSPVSAGTTVYGPISAQVSPGSRGWAAGIGPGFGLAVGVSAAPVSVEFTCSGGD